MAKFRAPRPKRKVPPVRGGAPCVILLLCGFALFLLFLYLVLRYANG